MVGYYWRQINKTTLLFEGLGGFTFRACVWGGLFSEFYSTVHPVCYTLLN